MTELTIYYSSILISSALLCIGIIIFLKRPFFKLVVFSTYQLDIIFDKSLKEEDKDKKLFQNIIKVISQLLLCITILLLLSAGGALLPVLYVHMNDEIKADTSSFYFYSSITAGSFILFLFRTKRNYSYWSKLLHTVILDNYALGKYLLEREFKKKPSLTLKADKDFLVVSGLARSGTTALANLIFNEKEFHSIKYSNMPFLLAPDLWKRVYNPNSLEKQERAHKDSILFNEQSIEALEEYFFKVNLQDSYIGKNHLRKHSISKDLLMKYYKYQELFKDTDHTTYFAKNNNFILRYESIRKLNSRFSVLLAFRRPINHAQSLLNQHRNFLSQQKGDGFILNYMNWLGHHEFGVNHKHFSLSKKNICIGGATKNDLSFWLQVWINYYSYVVEIYKPNQNLFLIHYEDIANNPTKLRKAIGTKIQKKLKSGFVEPFTRTESVSKDIIDANDPYLEKAEEIYHKLLLNKVQIN